MSVKIIVDSASDIIPADAEKMDVKVLPLKTLIDGTEYLDGVTITHEEFYDKLEDCDELPKTSQIAPFDFKQAFEDALENRSEIVAITLSGKFSGTAASARAAAEKFGDRVYVIDSMNATVGERILIEYAVRLRDEGADAKTIAEKLEEAKGRVSLVALFDTLEFLVKGGRLSKTAGLAGKLLKIKPVLAITDGELEVLGKARGSKKIHNFLNQAIEDRGGIDFSMPIGVAYTGNDDALLRGYIENSRRLWEDGIESLPVSTIGSTIGTHAGPGAIALAFFADKTE